MWAVLFTDLVGSTEQRARVGDSTADDLRREHDSIVRRAAVTNGGEVIKGTGDGAMLVFAGASDAIAAGAAIQQAIGRRNAGAHEPIWVRVGISLGDLAHENGDLYGMAANEAARLCARADKGEILVSELVRAVAGTRNTYSLVPRGAVELKGLPESVVVWTVDWDRPAGQRRIQFPRALTRSDALPFTSREAEVSELATVFARVQRGEPGAVVLAGEPGIGKTRLASHAAQSAFDEGALVLYGRCDEQLGIPFQPFVEILTSYFELSDAPRLGRYPEELARISPVVAARAGTLPAALRTDAPSEQHRLFDAVRSWIQAVADEQPLALIVDDVHWATSPTLLMLLHLLKNGDAGRLLVLATMRDTEVPPRDTAALLRELNLLPMVTTVALGGLDEESVRSLVHAELGVVDDRRADIAATIASRTGGNPFFIGEVLRDLRDVAPDAQAASAGFDSGAPLPSGAVRAVEYRVARLDEEAQTVLATAAVIGLEFRAGVVAVLTGLSEDATLGHLRRAIAAKLVHEVGLDVFVFSHALVQSALEQRLTASERMRMHRRIAEVLFDFDFDFDFDPNAAAVAFHWCAAGPCGDAEQVADAVIRVAHEALRRSAPQEAIEWYRRGEMAVQESSHAALLRLQIAAGGELSRAGRQQEAAAYLRAALERTEIDQLTRAELLRQLACGLRVDRSYSDAAETFAQASAVMNAMAIRDQSWWAEWLQTQLDLMELYYWTNEPREMAQIETSISDEVQRHGLASQRAAFAKNAALRRLRERRYVIDDEVVQFMDEAVRLSSEGDDPSHAFHLFNRGFVELWRRNLRDAERYMQAGLERAESAGDAVVAARCWTYLAVARRFGGDVDALRARLAKALELADICALPEYAAAAHGNRAWALLREERVQEAQDAAWEAIDIWRELPIVYAFQWQAWYPLLRVAADRRDSGLARRCVDAMLEPTQQQLPAEIDDDLRRAAHSDAADLAALVGRAVEYGYA
jgi:class 3 adenylate cyclase